MLIGYSAKNHPQQTKKRGTDARTDDRALSRETFEEMDRRFRFTIDVAASAGNAKCARYFSQEEDGLRQSWRGERVYCNPPYSAIAAWVAKAWESTSAEIIVMVLPANRTEQAFWQDMIEPYRDRAGSRLRCEFQRGRWRFAKPGATDIEPNNRPPFGVVLLIWSASNANE